MVFKHLDELTASELRIELKRAGIKGKYVKAQAIMRLTTHLIDISEDPLTFEFDPEMPIEEVGDDGGGPDEYEVLNDAPEAQPASSDNAGGSAASVSGLVNSIAAGTFTTTPPECWNGSIPKWPFHDAKSLQSSYVPWNARWQLLPSIPRNATQSS